MWVLFSIRLRFWGSVRILPIGDTFCYVSFTDEEAMSVFLRTRLLENWFSEVRAWEESELADGLIQRICIRGVPIPLWHNQFFSFAVADFCQFVEVLAATKEKLNLQNAWLKVRCIARRSIPSEMGV